MMRLKVILPVVASALTIEVPHRHAHIQGSPGLHGFTPQSRFRVYIDNLSVTQNG